MQKYALTTQICMQMLAKKISFPSTSLNLHAEICTKKSAEISLQNISVILTLFDVRTLGVEEKKFRLALVFFRENVRNFLREGIKGLTRTPNSELCG